MEDNCFTMLYCFLPSVQFSSVQSLSRVRLFVTPWIAARQASLSITNSWSSLRLTPIEWVMPSSHLTLCRPLLLLPQSLPASESFPMSQLFAWGGQSTGVSALASFLPKKSQGWSPLGWTGCISLQSKGLSRVFSNTTVQKHQFFRTQLSSHTTTQISHNYICNFFKQRFHSSEINNREKNILACFILSYLVNVIWNIWYPAIKEANLERLCFPEPPTPTSNAFPHDVRIIREICFEIK